jgi:hypothetical protein
MYTLRMLWHDSPHPLCAKICFRSQARNWVICKEKNVTDLGLPQSASVFPCLYILHTLRIHAFFYHERYIISAHDSVVK